MGEVYKADDLTLHQPIALKFLPETLAISPNILAATVALTFVAAHLAMGSPRMPRANPHMTL